jgi:hypothetical protein
MGDMSSGPGVEANVEISVLVPARGRAEPLAALYWEYASALRARGYRFEFLFLMDRRSPDLVHSLMSLAAQREPIRVLYAENTISDTILIRSAVAHACGDIVVILPPVPRVISAGVPLLIERVRAGADIAVACREPRRFSWAGHVRSRLFHSLLQHLTGTRLHDIPCGVRAIRKELFTGIPLYGDLIPYLPLLASRDGYKVEEIPLPQHPADHSIGFHGPGIHLRKLMDLLNLFFLMRFAERPLRFFGLTGGVAAAGGMVLLAVVFLQRLGGQALANRPILVLAVLLVILGVQAVALGLIGEVIVHLHASSRRPYRLASVTAADPTTHRETIAVR